MASSSADCVFGGVRLISSASRILPKIGPSTKVHLRWPVVRSSSMMSVPVMSDGIRSGVNWMRRNCKAERVGDGAHHQRFRRAGHAGQEAVAADKDGDQDLVEHFFLADDDFAHLLQDRFAHRVETLDALLESAAS